MILLRAQVSGPQVNQWTATPDMAMARDAACSVLLADGRVMVAGGNSSSGVVSTVDLFGSGGSFTAGPAMLQPRANAACSLLKDGTVLVTGGTDGKVALSSAEIFSPTQGTWTSVGSMTQPRFGHTSTLTPWGAVLIIGGQSEGKVTDSVEAYLTDGSFRAIGNLSSPRTDYALSIISGRRVMIAGGTDGQSTLSTIDIYNADNNTITPGGTMMVARKNFGAATLVDGTVMFTGGFGADGKVLDSSEIFDPIAFTSRTGPQMPSGRANHQSISLPNNGTLLLIGGTDGSNSIGSTDAYEPWTGKFTRKAPLNTSRTGQTTAAMRRGSLITAGGLNGSAYLAGGEIYNFATAESDRPDYQPGSVATFTGIGWKPGETVSLAVAAFPADQHQTEFSGTAVADSTGQIHLSGFNIDKSHLGMRFILTATGSQSTAQLFFTDTDLTAVSLNVGFPSPASPQAWPIVAPGVTFTGTVNDTTNPNVGPPGVSGTANLIDNGIAVTNVPVTSCGHPGCFSFTNIFPGPGPHDYQIQYIASPGWFNSLSVDIPYIVGPANTTTGISGGGSEPFGANNIGLTAVVNSAAQSGDPGGTLTFKSGSSPLGDCSAFSTPGPAPDQTTFTCTPTALPVGIYTYTAFYNGLSTTLNGNSYPVWNQSSGGTANITVTAVNTTTTLTASPASPVAAGTTVTMTATVVPAFGAGPSGTVQFFVDAVAFGAPVAVVPGVASSVVSMNWNSVAGSPNPHSLTAQFTPTSANFNGSLSNALSYNVTPWATTTTVVPTPGASGVFGTTETFTANISNVCGVSCGAPTGAVNFQDASNGNIVIGSGTVSPNGLNGVATLNISNLQVGLHQIVGVYVPTGGIFLGSSSAAASYTVTQLTPVVTLQNAPASPVNMGTNVTFTAQVATTAGITPTGTVTLFVNGVAGPTAALNNGQVILNYTFSTIPVPNPAVVTAHYNGDTNYAAAVSANDNINVLINATSTTQVSTNAPGGGAPFGSSVTYTATVTINPASVVSAPVSNLPGTVSFTDNGTPIPACTGAAVSNATQGVGTITCTEPSPLPGGGHTIVATYTGATNASGTIAGSNGTANFTVTLNSTSITIATQAPVGTGSNNSVYGQTMRMRSVVTVTPPGTGTPTGNVQFLDGSTVLGSSPLNGSGVATFDTALLTVGTHSLTAVYLGDTNDATSTTGSPATFTVNKDTATVTVTFSPASPVALGTAVTLSGAVAADAPGGQPGAAAPTGTVTFFDNGVQIGTGVAHSPATFTTSNLTGGVHVFTATYGGDSNYLANNTPSAGSSPLTVNAVQPSIVVTATPNPDIYGQSYTLTATVTGIAPFSPSGSGNNATVTFSAGANIPGCVTRPVTSIGAVGTATCVPAVGALPTGPSSIVATYIPDATVPVNYNGNASAAYSFTINPEPINFTIASSANPSIPGQSITFTATAVAPPPGAIVPAGAVTFFDGANPIPGCAGAVLTVAAPYQATCTAPTGLALGNHTITLTFSPSNANETTGTVTPLTQNVNQATVDFLIASSNLNATYGSLLTFTVTVSAHAPATGTPTGSVTFFDGGVAMGPAVVLNGAGVGTLTVGPGGTVNTPLGVGTHTITVLYGGDANFGSVLSTASQSINNKFITQVVTQATPTVSQVTASPSPQVFGAPVTFTTMVSGPGGAPVPLGTVQFFDGANPIGAPVNIPFNPAQPTTPQPVTVTSNQLSAGNHNNLTAVYNGSANYATATSAPAGSESISRAPVTVTVNPMLPAVFGQSVTYITAQVLVNAPSTINPTIGNGSITFFDNGIQIGAPTAISALGIATLAPINMNAPPMQPPIIGNHIITAQYNDTSGNYATPSPMSAPQTLTVGKAATTTVVTSSANPSVSGQSITFTATVQVSSPGSGLPAAPDTVQFYAGATALGLPVTLSNVGGVATAQITLPNTTTNPVAALALGQYIITAAYIPGVNSTFLPSTSGLPALVQEVDQAQTTTTISSSSNGATTGQQITLTAQVTVNLPGQAGVGNGPTGTVQFVNNLASGNPTVLGFGTVTRTPSGASFIYIATLTTSAIPTGNEAIQAIYSGDVNYAPSTSTVLNQSITKSQVVINVVSSLNPSSFGQPVTFTVTVSPAAPATGIPTGTIVLYDGGNIIANIALVGGQGLYTVVLPVGGHNISVSYPGDQNFQGSVSSPINETVQRIQSTLNLTSNVVNAVASQVITFTAQIQPTPLPGVPYPTGQVGFFMDGGTQIGAGQLQSGVATVSTTLPAGNHQIQAFYLGDNNWTPAQSIYLQQAVGTAGTTTLVASSVNPSVWGQPVTFTVTIAVPFPGTIPANGQVQLYDNNNALGNPFSAANGTFTATFTNLAPGTHNIIAQFIANGSFSGSASANLTQLVNKAPTATQLMAFPASSTSGQSVTMTAVVSIIAPGAGTPTGTVQFVNTTTQQILGTSPLNLIGGVYTATATTTALQTGSQTQLITATYSGDTNFATSTSAPQGQSVFQTQITIVNAAGQTTSNFAPDSLATAWGTNLAYTSLSATGTSLPTSLAGTTVTVTDSAGVSRLAPLLFVSLSQINFYMPSNTAYGLATVTVTNASGENASEIILITPTAPGLFTSNQTGSGVAAGFVIRVHADGTQDNQVPLFQFDPNQKIFVPSPISMTASASTDTFYLVLYGTGIRYGSKNVTANIGGINVPVLFANAQPQFGIFGEDQVNMGPIPASLKGAGTVPVYITVNGQASNTVQIAIQ
jgi:large repetitive protein